jgi:peptide/nickel transport system ATP-binding protein
VPGEIVEWGTSDEMIVNPQHPYPQLLAQAATHPEKRLVR